MAPENISFQQYLAYLLSRKGWKQADLCRKSGCVSSHISQVLTHGRSVSPATVKSWAEALELSAQEYELFFDLAATDRLHPDERTAFLGLIRESRRLSDAIQQYDAGVDTE